MAETSGLPKSIEINPTFLSGLISLSGILVGFITAIVTGRESLPSWIYVILLLNWGLLSIAAIHIFFCALGLAPTLNAVAWTMSSLMSNHITAGTLLVLHLLLSKREKRDVDTDED